MKVLVFTPTYKRVDGSIAIWPDCKDSIKALQCGVHKVTYWLSVDEKENKVKNVLTQYQKARLRALSEDFDALLLIESDMIVPPDTLVKLADVEKADAVYGVYLFRHGKPVLNAYRYVDSINADMSLQNYPRDLEQAWKQKVIPVSGLGFGCLLIYRRVLEQIEFRAPVDGAYPDGPFANDCQRMGFKQYARFDVICGHIQDNGYVLWPSSNPLGWAETCILCEIRKNFNGNVNGESLPFMQGTQMRIPLDAAVEFGRAGLVSMLRPDPALEVPGRVMQATRVGV